MLPDSVVTYVPDRSFQASPGDQSLEQAHNVSAESISVQISAP